MKTAKDFFIAIPELCKSKNAERWARINEIQFDSELDGGTLFDKNADDKRSPFNRLETAFGFTAFQHDQDRARYCKILAELFMLAHYAIEHNETGHEGRIKALMIESKGYKDMYPDIDEYMTAEKAVLDGGWL